MKKYGSGSDDLVYERAISGSWRAERVRQSSIHEMAPVLPPGHWQDFDPFLMMAEDWFQTGTIAEHPHRGIETVTYIIDGHMAHYDNKTGRGGILGPGDVQWMTAGRGVIHKEDPVPGETVHSLQLWINLPSDHKMTVPRYQELQSSQMLTDRGPGTRIRVLSGTSCGVQANTLNYVPITMLEVLMDGGSCLEVDLPGDYNGFLYVLNGRGRFGATNWSGQQGEVLWLSMPEGGLGPPTSQLAITAETALRVWLAAGKPLRQPVVAYGPFVMNSMEQIHQAFTDYQSGRFL